MRADCFGPPSFRHGMLIINSAPQPDFCPRLCLSARFANENTNACRRSQGERRMENSFTTRAALPVEIGRLAALWNEGWKDAHQAILPEQLRQDRTLERLRRRLE